MKYPTRIISLLGATTLLVAASAAPVVAADEVPKHILIAEVSPEAKDSASKEYIVLYNPDAAEVDVSGWQLQYRSASHTSGDTSGWTTKAIIGCQSTKASDCADPTKTVIAAGETLRLSSFETGDGIAPLASGMATTGGELRLVQPAVGAQPQATQDKVGYGSAADHEGEKAAPTPKAGRGIVRAQNELGAYIDTDHNDVDFVLMVDEDADPPVVPPTDEPQNPGDVVPGQGAGSPTSYRDAEITEVLPDPASPQLDSADEFIELYNPYAEQLDLTGYVLKTGTDWTHKYTLSQVTLDPYGYVALTAAQTHLSLSNSGSGVRLYDPAGNLLYEAPSYGKAQTGNSWAKGSNGQWAWTTKPTPGEQNSIEVPTVADTAKKTTTVAATKKPAAKSTTTATKKASTPKSPSSAVKGLTTSSGQAASAQPAGNQAGMWVLAGAGVLGTGYALFEYRQEIGGFVRRRWDTLAGLVTRK